MTIHPLETELKLAATPAMLETLRAHPHLAGADQAATLVTTYFDTIGGKLRRVGAALRIRDGGKGREQTLKLITPYGATVRRNEWNVTTAGDIPDPAGFPVRARSALVRLLDGAPLEPVATTTIERTTRRLHFGSSAIEVAFDTGTIRAGERVDNVCELELELVEGHLADVIALVLCLPLGPELRWSVSSKAERCHALAFDLQVVAAHARPVKLLPSMNAARGFQAIAWNCLEQLLANYTLVIGSGDPEALHQTRVAIRRLRAAGKLFGKVTDDDAAPVLRAELKAVASALGPARDLQVLHGRVAAQARAGGHDFGELLGHLDVRQVAALRGAQALLGAEPFQRLLFDVAGWIEGGEWLVHKQETGGNQPLVPFAAHVMSRRRRKLRQVDDRLADLSDATRHRLRVDGKILRYAAEFFASLYRDRGTARQRLAFGKAAERLQDSLGELNDMAVATGARDALFTDLEPIAAARQAAQLEGLLDAQAKSQAKLVKTAERALAKLTEAAAWWKAG